MNIEKMIIKELETILPLDFNETFQMVGCTSKSIVASVRND